jgi:dienelactone hydrolase
MVMGFCIGGPFIWNLLKRAPNRVVAAVLAQPSGSCPERRDLFYDSDPFLPEGAPADESFELTAGMESPRR